MRSPTTWPTSSTWPTSGDRTQRAGRGASRARRRRALGARAGSALPPGYEVIRPPAALAHGAGHAWEQAVLPARARGARLLLNPANLAPLAFPRNAVVIHDAAALRHPGWYSPVYARWQRGILPLVARRARLVITVSEFSRRELAELLNVEAAVVPGGIDARFAPDADPEPRAPRWA